MLNYCNYTRSTYLVDILRWMFESSRTVTVSKLWWEIDRDPSFKCEDKKFKYEEEIWPIVDFLVNSHQDSIQEFSL
jgi:hypothetical protein